MKFLITGLGNIGDEYANTRHNIGFQALDAYAKKAELTFRTDRLAHVCEKKIKGRQVVFIKPTTYMNLSGKAINYWLQKENIAVENLLVIVDDVALPLGNIRIRTQGSDAGHNGLANIIQTLGHNNFSRLRFGIGNNYPKGQQIDYVLGQWTTEEQEKLPERFDQIQEAIHSFITIGISRTMNIFNGK